MKLQQQTLDGSESGFNTLDEACIYETQKQILVPPMGQETVLKPF